MTMEEGGIVSEQDPKCSEHALEFLTPVERVAYETARSRSGRQEDTGPNVVTVLIAAIARLEDMAQHASWGALQCDRPAITEGVTAGDGKA